MTDMTKELSALDGIPYWKWAKLKAYVDSQFEVSKKENVLAVNKNTLRNHLIDLAELELET